MKLRAWAILPAQVLYSILGFSGLYHLNYTPTINFPISSVGEDVRAMPQHRQAFSTPRGYGKIDPKGDGMRLPDVVLHRLW